MWIVVEQIHLESMQMPVNFLEDKTYMVQNNSINVSRLTVYRLPCSICTKKVVILFAVLSIFVGDEGGYLINS